MLDRVCRRISLESAGQYALEDNLEVEANSPHGVSKNITFGVSTFNFPQVSMVTVRPDRVDCSKLSLAHHGTSVLHMDTSTHQVEITQKLTKSSLTRPPWLSFGWNNATGH